MTANARLAKLEGALSPKAATLLWLADAHQFPTLAAYVAWLVDQPVEAAPFWRVPEQVETAVRATTRGEPRSTVQEARRQAVRDAVFLVELVIRLNVEAAEMVRVEGVRYAALCWEARALAAEAEREAGSQDSHTIARRCGAFRSSVSDWRADLGSATETRHLLERRYFDGREMLFPEVADLWVKVLEFADALASAADRVAPSPGTRPRRAHAPRGRTQAGSRATASAAQMTDIVRQTTRSMLGDPTGAVAAMAPHRVTPAS